MSLPNAPTDVVATITPPGIYPTVHDGTLTWTDNTGGLCGHRIYRKHDGTNGPPESWHLYATTATGVASYHDNGPLVPQNIYTYYVVAFNQDGESARPEPATIDEVTMMVKAFDPG